MQKKWVELFEKVIGRKPTAEEFIAGRETGFDFKAIKSIAGVAIEPVPTEPIGQGDQEKVEDVVNPLQLAWEERFIALYGRSPLPEEIESARSQNFEIVEAPAPTTDFKETNQTTQVFAPVESPSEASESLSLPVEDIAPAGAPELEEPVKKVKKEKKGKKKKVFLFSLLALLVLILSGLGFYFSSTTGPQVTVDKLVTAIEQKDYRKVASILSSDKDKWTKEEAQSLLDYMTSQKIDVIYELDHIAQSSKTGSVKDKKQNLLIGIEKTDKKFGIFQEYRIVTYPVEVTATTNLEDATLKMSEKTSTSLKKNQTTKLGQVHFASRDMQLDGKTEVGKISSEVKLDPAQASKNKLNLTFNSEKRLLEIEFPEEVSNPTDIKVAVNGKEVGTSTLFEVDVVAHQEIEVHAVFSVNGESYTTEKAKVTIGESPDDDEVITLKLSKDVAKRLKDAETARKAKEEEVKKAEEKKTSITSFLQDYRTEVFSSVSSRSNTYSKYYDTSSDAYKEMVEWTTGGGVKKAEIDYYTPGVFNVLSVTEENGSIIVKTHEEYTVHYVTSRKDSQSSKDKTYTLKPVGDTYVITAITVTAGN
ncbi:TcaA second domain-containing protein [Streptococcus sp.]